MFQKSNQLFQNFKFLRCNVIILEGTIGVGKTTLGTSMENFLNGLGIRTKFYKEFVNEKLLAQYINNMEKYSYTYELMMMTYRINIYREAKSFADSGGVAILDRSVIGDYAFGLLQKKRGFISEEEWNILISRITKENLPEPDYVIHLNCEPDVAISRTTKRSSDAEKKYTLEYFLKLKEAYDQAMIDVVERKGIHKSIPHLYLDWNTDLEIKLNDSSDECQVHDAKYVLDDEDIISILNSIRDTILNRNISN